MVLAGVPPLVNVSAAAGRGGIGLYEWHPSTKELWWDDTLAGIFVADRPDETPLETWRRRVHPADRERVTATFAELREAEDHYRLVLDDGTIRYVLGRATHVHAGDDQQPAIVTGVIIDVTIAHEASARIGRMLEAISDGFLAVDREYRLTYLNARAERMLGVDRDRLLGRNLFDVFPEAVGTRFESAYAQVMTERVGVVFEEYYPAPLGMWTEVNAQPSADGMVVYFQDVTERRTRQQEREALLLAERRARRDAEDARQQLAHQAMHDPLTGLLNRTELAEQAQRRALAEHCAVTVLFLDLDRFKLINDSRGHAAGDRLLVEVARRITRSLRPDDLVARLGGDEFAAVLCGHDMAAAEAVADRLLHAIQEPVDVDGRAVAVSASIGLAAGSSSEPFELLLRNADVALYRAKDAGRNRSAWFDADAHAELVDRIELEADLRTAIGTDAMTLAYQPVFASSGMRVVGAEALARWTHPVRGPVPPAAFIAVAEDGGLIDRLTDHVLRLACAQARAWADIPDFRVWVNISPRQLHGGGLADAVLAQLRHAAVPGGRLGIEVTESALLDHTVAEQELAALATAGVAIAIDDFGTGYSSLARLNSLAVDALKIDRSFVSQLHHPKGRAAVDAIVKLAHALGMTTTAEGVETPAQLEAVRDLGADFVSGYLLGRPAPAGRLPGRPCQPSVEASMTKQEPSSEVGTRSYASSDVRCSGTPGGT